MINIRNKNILLLTLVVVTFFIGVLANDPFMWFEKSYAKSKPLIKDVTIDAVKKITVVGAGDQRIFSRTSHGWALQSNNNTYTSDARKVNESLQKLLDIRRYQQVTSNKEKYAELEVTDDGFHVVLEGDNSREIAKIILGKTGSSYNTTMVRLAGEGAVYAAKGTLRDDFNQEINSYRDKTLLMVAMPNVKEVTLTGKARFRLYLNEVNSWQLVLKGKEVAADKKKVEGLLNTLVNLHGTRFIDQKFSAPILKINIALQGNLVKELNVFGPTKEGEYAVSSTDNPSYLAVSKYTIDNLIDKPEDFEQKNPLPAGQ